MMSFSSSISRQVPTSSSCAAPRRCKVSDRWRDCRKRPVLNTFAPASSNYLNYYNLNYQPLVDLPNFFKPAHGYSILQQQSSLYRTVMEDFSLEVKGELQQIFKVLSKQEHDKMPFEGIQIAKSLSRLPFFRRFFDTNTEHFINLCIAQDAIIVPEGTSMYKKEAGDGRERYIYVVLQGRFCLSSEECGSRELNVLRIFGQTEILFGLDSRRETAIALEESKVMRLKESAVLKIFNKRDEIKKCLHFMDVNQYFNQLKQLQKMQLSLAMVRRPFEKGTILKVEGEKFEDVLFFIYGKVEVTTHIAKNGKEKQFIIDFLEELSTFGEHESVTGTGTALKLRGVISGAYYSLNYSEVKRQNHKIAEIIQENAIPYPNNQQLQFLEAVKSTLKTEEKKVTKSLFCQY